MKLDKLIRLDKIVEEVLREDTQARKDDNYLIFKVVQITNPELAGSTFANVMFSAKSKGISFESITRARRKVQQRYPELVDCETESARQVEQIEYMEYANSNHIPYVD